ncbi:hypothetical protein L596_025145 [Steinernema carpocapsae]|uniref:Uncharacterized protein n=1 Tax=Steinernema carpocapsae TaxID=34508 RepID=A0A4U5M6Y4_STECR|nr:hypothetical protein L596_025145 [Steinernema carpocapsae]
MYECMDGDCDGTALNCARECLGSYLPVPIWSHSINVIRLIMVSNSPGSTMSPYNPVRGDRDRFFSSTCSSRCGLSTSQTWKIKEIRSESCRSKTGIRCQKSD